MAKRARPWPRPSDLPAGDDYAGHVVAQLPRVIDAVPLGDRVPRDMAPLRAISSKSSIRPASLTASSSLRRFIASCAAWSAFSPFFSHHRDGDEPAKSPRGVSSSRRLVALALFGLSQNRLIKVDTNPKHKAREAGQRPSLALRVGMPFLDKASVPARRRQSQ